MESDRTNATTSEGVSDGLQRVPPLHGRTSGPRRRSTKGQWTAEEDDILCKAVQRFKGKNWKKIAECFKDRTDVQCLHRWQKVLNPELVKGPWSKEEDEIIVELVDKYGPKKWSTIAQHLPGRIGKQCRERWHNHLNPNINKQAWTQEEELALIRAHQIYGNKWAELMKFLPGRSDNAIKNHWNSSVKKKLDSYLASGLLAQFQGLPHHVRHPNQSMPSSSSTVQQSSGDDSIPKEETDAEEISECSQGSTVIGCSQSGSDIANVAAYTRDDWQLPEESSRGKDPSFSPASCSENYHTSFQEVAFSMPDVPCEVDGSSKFLQQNFSNDWESFAGKDWQLNLNDLLNITSLDLGQKSSEFLIQCLGGNENHEVVPFPLQTCVSSSASPSMGNMDFESDQPSNYQLPETAGTSSSQSYYHRGSHMLETLCSQPYAVPSQLPPDDGAIFFASDANQFNDLSHANQEKQLVNSPNEGFICTNDSVNSPRDNGTDGMGLQDQPDQANDSLKVVPVDAFSSGPPNHIQTSSSVNDSPIVPTSEQQDRGPLFYEPPRFPSLDIPFFSCDLIQSDNYTQQEYSPLGIRQLMMSTVNCFTPFRFCDSPSQDGSPDAVLKSAAKTFTCTPSILKKRTRDLVSPMSEKRVEKKLESDMNLESFSSLARDFSRLDVMFDENGNKKAPLRLSPSSNQKGKSGNSTSTKENLNQCSRKLDTTLNQSALSEFSSGNPCSSSIVNSAQSAPASNPQEIMAGSSGNAAGAENLNIFIDTPFKRSIESPSAWKSPWFINSFVPGLRVDTDITIEDIGYFMSPGDRSYDAIGLMKQLSEHTAAAFADAQEVLGDATPETVLKERCSNHQNPEQENNCTVFAGGSSKAPKYSSFQNITCFISNLLENNRRAASFACMTERRVLDFSECGTPGKGKGNENGILSTTKSFSSPPSYLLKGCR
ncbi:hypothetical protein TEA_022303 [Camellia sinensis var. sinensis]|uniref:Uncharacterized protein n=1 Tax=Camellia sinensis var. sinensis TaxID=542762 RepID=A0A4S4D924_CAMSN|nr:hypothetical protein TEA_022303 [Camellia sinensis var. sinensis]